jgi:membrane-associated protease RseP (regulator of RpoE activity)
LKQNQQPGLGAIGFVLALQLPVFSGKPGMQECTVQEGRGEWQPWRHAPSTPPTQQATTGRTILIQRANDGSVGLRFSRPGQMTHGPLEVTGLIPGSPSANTALKPGDLICEVDGQDISTLQESHVAGLFRGPPRSPLVLRVEPTVQVPALEERSPSNLVDQGLAWVTRNGVLPTQSIQGFEELMRRLQAVSVPMDQVDTVCGQLTTGNVIGKGANGSVMRANLQGTAVAVKHVNPRTTKPLHLL